ncbi:hypothetical protein D3C72_1782090 [compost metagenome]
MVLTGRAGLTITTFGWVASMAMGVKSSALYGVPLGLSTWVTAIAPAAPMPMV